MLIKMWITFTNVEKKFILSSFCKKYLTNRSFIYIINKAIGKKLLEVDYNEKNLSTK